MNPFFPDGLLETIAKKRKTFKKLRNLPFVAKLSIAAGSGRLIETPNHVDFWMYDTFDLMGSIVQVEAL
jgi:hypothetical protein